MEILVTGGAGYIGSHTVIELAAAGFTPVVIDNYSNSSPHAMERVTKILGSSVPSFREDVAFYEGDARDGALLDMIFEKHNIGAVIHFAGLKSVGESVSQPLSYYRTNIDSTLTLLERMQVHGVKGLVFSSSATVYGVPEKLPLTESMPRRSTNPYGWTKVMIEQILEDLAGTQEGWNITSLRYFNPVGAHNSGLIGENPRGIPNNLLPYVSQVAVGKRNRVMVFGNDYPTVDGTGVRDYIHITDLAKAHVAALRNLDHPDMYKAYNIGTGRGVSVLEIIKAFSAAVGRDLPYEIVARRPGDVASCYASADLAREELGWSASLTVEDACRDSWAWQSNNPDGF
ncbi:UDP-glucose 4-epimerase GalE [Ancrocorticia populi]|uniref:UDP-glucose 4-epimerase GalE n=1 Tax=Ancrocorticia populi TaxID=2175228 RepID=UPI00271066A7|nr:UDP-glucose 4-epimerase GalE [Ancrocorticia sp.]